MSQYVPLADSDVAAELESINRQIDEISASPPPVSPTVVAVSRSSLRRQGNAQSSTVAKTVSVSFSPRSHNEAPARRSRAPETRPRTFSEPKHGESAPARERLGALCEGAGLTLAAVKGVFEECISNGDAFTLDPRRHFSQLCQNPALTLPVLEWAVDHVDERVWSWQEDGKPSPLQLLCQNGALTDPIMRLIAKRTTSDDWSQENEDGQTALQLLCAECRTALASKWCSLTVDTLREATKAAGVGRDWLTTSTTKDKTEDRRSTPLHMMCQNRGLTKRAFMYLVDQTNETDGWSQIDKDGHSPLHLLCKCHHDASLLSGEVFRYLHEKLPRKAFETAWELPVGGDEAVGYQKWSRETPLHFLCQNPHLTLEILQNATAKDSSLWDDKDANGRTPLHELCSQETAVSARSHQWLDMLKFATNNGKSIANSLVDDGGRSRMGPMLREQFHILAGNQNLRANVLKWFVSEMESTNVSDIWLEAGENGRTALHCLCGNVAMDVNLLAAETINPSGGLIPDEAAKAWAAKAKTERKIVQETKSEPGISEEYGYYTPLHCLCANVTRLNSTMISLVVKQIRPSDPLWTTPTIGRVSLADMVPNWLEIGKKEQWKTAEYWKREYEWKKDKASCEDMVKLSEHKQGEQWKQWKQWGCMVFEPRESLEAPTWEAASPLRMLFDSCTTKDLRLRRPGEEESKGLELLGRSIHKLPELGYLLTAKDQPVADAKSALRCLLFEEYGTEQRSESHRSMSYKWLSARALWQENRIAVQRAKAGGATSPTQRLETVGGLGLSEDPLMVVIELQLSTIIEKLVNMMIEKQMFSDTHYLRDDLRELLKQGPDQINLATRILEEGGLHEVKTTHYQLPPVDLGAAQQRWYTPERDETGKPDTKWHMWEQYRYADDDGEEPPLSPADSRTGSRKIKVIRTVSVTLDSYDGSAEPSTNLDVNVSKGYQGSPRQKKRRAQEWDTERSATLIEDDFNFNSLIDDTVTIRYDDDGSEVRVSRSDLLMLDGPGDCWKVLGDKSGCKFDEDDSNWKRKDAEELEHVEDQGLFGSQVVAKPCVLSIRGAGKGGQHGLLNILLSSKDIEVSIFGCDAIKLLIDYKWEAYGKACFRKGIFQHLLLLGAWQYLTFSVSNTPQIEGAGTLFFPEVTKVDAIVAGLLCFFAGTFLPGSFTRFEAEHFRCGRETKKTQLTCYKLWWRSRWFTIFTYVLRFGAIVVAFVLLEGCDSWRDTKMALALVVLLATTCGNLQNEYRELRYSFDHLSDEGEHKVKLRKQVQKKRTEGVSSCQLNDRSCRFYTFLVVQALLALLLAVLLDTYPAAVPYLMGLMGLGSCAWIFTWNFLVRCMLAVHTYLDVWNFVDVTSLSLVAVTAVRVIMHADRGTTSQLAAINTVFLWFRVIHYFSGFQATAKYVRMFTAITSSMFTFLAMLAIFVAGNSFVLVLLYPNALEDDVESGGVFTQNSSSSSSSPSNVSTEFTDWTLSDTQEANIQDQFGSIGETIFTSFNMMFMSFDVEVLDRAYSPRLAKVLYVYYVVVVPLIMLNLLIALMGGVHDRVKDNEEWAGNRLRAELLLSFEKTMSYEDRHREEWHPTWIHALLPRKKLRQIRDRRDDARKKREEEARRTAEAEGGLEEFEVKGFSERVNISLNTLLPTATVTTATHGNNLASHTPQQQQYSLELRTLDELSLSNLLPDETAQDYLRKAIKWTDNVSTPKQFDPFVSLSQGNIEISDGRSGNDGGGASNVSNGLVIRRSTEKSAKAHRRIRDQLVNVISKGFSTGHIGLDNGLQYKTERYVYGLTFEKRNTPHISQKYRVLLVKKSHLEGPGLLRAGHVSKGAELNMLMGEHCEPRYANYKKDRLKKLQTLSQLYERDPTGEKQLYLVGDVSVVVPCPGGEKAAAASVNQQVEDKVDKLTAEMSELKGMLAKLMEGHDV
eukprot:COSAG05_NODE_423_length_9941_cov_241.298821_4_plen_1929_part_00